MLTTSMQPLSWTAGALLLAAATAVPQANVSAAETVESDSPMEIIEEIVVTATCRETRLQDMPESAKERASGLALARLAIGEVEETLEWMEVAHGERDVGLIWSREYPAFDELRDNARFQDLIDRLNLPGQRDDIVADDPLPNPETRLQTAVSQHFPTVIFGQNEEKVAISHNVDYCC